MPAIICAAYILITTIIEEIKYSKEIRAVHTISTNIQGTASNASTTWNMQSKRRINVYQNPIITTTLQNIVPPVIGPTLFVIIEAIAKIQKSF